MVLHQSIKGKRKQLIQTRQSIRSSNKPIAGSQAELSCRPMSLLTVSTEFQKIHESLFSPSPRIVESTLVSWKAPGVLWCYHVQWVLIYETIFPVLQKQLWYLEYVENPFCTFCESQVKEYCVIWKTGSLQVAPGQRTQSFAGTWLWRKVHTHGYLGATWRLGKTTGTGYMAICSILYLWKSQ